MKARILSFAIALIALFAFNDAFAQNPHFVGTPCYDPATGDISGKVAGLGKNANGVSITVTGDFSCDNPKDKAAPGWQSVTKSNIPLTRSNKAGEYTFDANVNPCNRNWSLTGMQNVKVYLVRGTEILDEVDAVPCGQ
jgi:hypothetical protein